MKKTFLSMLMIASCFSVANAQLMVDENGKVGVGMIGENIIPLTSKLALNGIGRSDSEVYLTSGNSNTLYVNREAGAGSALSTGINCTSTVNTSGSNVGIYSVATGNTAHTGSYVLLARSLSPSAGLAVGVYGLISPSSNITGAAVLGNAVNTTIAFNVGGHYAGFFYGDTRVTGTMTAGAFVTSSDYRLKKNIRSLSSSDGCLGKIMDLNVVEFDHIQRTFDTNDIELTLQDSAVASICSNEAAKVNWYKDDSPVISNKHYGLIAQELKEIYPDLVVESQDGYLAINYLEIIPLLIRSVQELKGELDASKNINAPVQREIARTADVEATAIDAIVTTLYQNTPNPFTESTLIRCDVADDVVKADLYIYNMNGEQITEYAVSERGETSIAIDGGSLNAGMYLYALIADGQVIDTKRMILTK